jgi:hypothetical protein
MTITQTVAKAAAGRRDAKRASRGIVFMGFRPCRSLLKQSAFPVLGNQDER